MEKYVSVLCCLIAFSFSTQAGIISSLQDRVVVSFDQVDSNDTGADPYFDWSDPVAKAVYNSADVIVRQRSTSIPAKQHVTYVRFDVSTLTAAEVNSAFFKSTLTLTVSYVLNSNGMNVLFEAVDTGNSWSNSVGSYPLVSWARTNGSVVASDVTGLTAGSDIELDMTSLVKDWVNGTVENNGIVFYTSQNVNQGVGFDVISLSSTIPNSPVSVSSFSELQSYLGADNAYVEMTPGTYRITPEDCDSTGVFTNETLLSFSGTNSFFDFTDVTFEFETEVFQSFGSVNVTELAVTGSDLVLKNLTMIDIGTTRPAITALGIKMDGWRNRLEGFNQTVRGSFPYGYGDAFGKGGGSVIKHYKHAALLVGGDGNHVKDCKIFHRAYGHGIFCQGSVDAVIEGCYVEGEMRTTDDMLLEAGSGTKADEKNFMTVWDYTLPSGWMRCLQEDGIRCYNTGRDQTNGVRNTRNVQVIDCTVKNMRSAITIGFCDGTKSIDNCVAIGCQSGYWVGSGGTITESAGNAPYGPLLVDAYEADSKVNVDLTIVDHENVYGNHSLIWVGGREHSITLRGRDAIVDSSLNILMGGIREGASLLLNANDFSMVESTINNLTGYPLVFSENASGNTGQSQGAVTDLGSNNNLSSASVHSVGGFAVLQTIEAEDFSAQSGVDIRSAGVNGLKVGSIHEGDWICFDDFFFGSGPNRFDVVLKHGGVGSQIELRLDGVNGELIGTCSVDEKAEIWQTQTITLQEPRGKHDVYLVFAGTSDELMELDSFRFYGEFPGRETINGLVGYWSFDEGTGSVTEDSSGFGHTGTVVDAVWVDGVRGKALEFNGRSSFVSIPSNVFDSISAEVSVAFWAYGANDMPNQNSVLYAVDQSDNRVLNIHLPWKDSIFWDTGYGSGYDRVGTAVLDSEIKGSWIHWVFTKNVNTGNMRIYRNGEPWNVGIDQFGLISEVVSAQIGRINSYSYSGMIDEFRVYDEELLSNEVTDLYESYFYTISGTPFSWLDAQGFVSGGDYETADQSDFDGDGLSNGGEYHAGTSPTNPASVFKIFGADINGEQLNVDWTAVSGKTYEVWSSTNLTGGSWVLTERAISGVDSSCKSKVPLENYTGFIKVEVEQR